jgi:translation initiation factor 3 subunit K
VQSDSYSLSANLALLRMYAIYPEKTIVRTLSQLLVKAIMRLPSTDFATLLHLIPERLQVGDAGTV